jgi:FG-GAP repeat protein
MRMVRVNLIVSLVLLLSASAAGQDAGRAGRDSSAALAPWRQLAKLNEAHGKSQDWLGSSVAISKDGNTATVGAVGWCPLKKADGCGQGAIFVFVRPTSGWADMTETAMLLASDGQPGEYLGASVAISDDGSAIVAGAPLWPANGTFMGAAYVFVRPAGGWANMTETARLTSTDGSNVSLGQSVAISGHTVAAGGPTLNTDQGAVYVFVEPAQGWTNRTQTARLTPSDGPEGDMGYSVSINGHTIVAGAPSANGEAGNGAYVFVKPKSGWKNRTENAKMTASRGTGFKLGYSVSISSDTIAVGAPTRDNDNGGVYLYVKPTSGWRSMTETARLTVPPKFNVLGFSVSADSDGKNIVGGAPGWQDGVGQGAADFFVKPGSGWRTTSKPDATLTASNGRPPDQLGSSASASPTAIVAGAPYAPSGSNSEEGTAYVFGR